METKTQPVKFINQRCGLCSGFGTLKYGSIRCGACMGKGIVVINQESGLVVEQKTEGRK